MKKFGVFLLVVMLAILLVATASAEEPKWTICHATGSASNPFTRIVVSIMSFGGHFDAQGNPLHGGDILLEGEQDCPGKGPEPVSCARCSTVADFTWVEWTELDGDCDNAVQSPNEDRVETYPSEACGAIFGCMDDSASNFDPDANFDDKSCEYPEPEECARGEIASSVFNFSQTGWAGWSCPAGEVIVSGYVIPSDFPTSVSQAAKDGVAPYPVYPHYTYTPPEEGWVVQAGGTAGQAQICMVCEVAYEVCSQTIVRGPVDTYGDWSDWVWDEGLGFFIRTRTVTSTYYIVDSIDRGHICNTRATESEEIQRRAPNEVLVGVVASCGRSVDGIVYQLQGGVAVEPSGGATLSMGGVDYTASTPWWGGFGTHTWSAVSSEGYVIVTADAGSFEINNSDCNESPEDTPETGGGSEIGIVLAGSMTLAGIGFAILGAREWAKEKKEKKG